VDRRAHDLRNSCVVCCVSPIAPAVVAVLGRINFGEVGSCYISLEGYSIANTLLLRGGIALARRRRRSALA
jgi:hypothetical protein